MKYNVNDKVIYVGFNHQYENRLIERKGQPAIMIPAPYLTTCKISLEGYTQVCDDNIDASGNYDSSCDDNGTVTVYSGQRILGDILDSQEHPDNIIVYTEARCSHGDNFCKLSGRKIAFNKALAILSAAGLLNKSERAQLFNQVFPQYKRNKQQNQIKELRKVMVNGVAESRRNLKKSVNNARQMKILTQVQEKSSSVWNQIKTWWSK